MFCSSLSRPLEHIVLVYTLASYPWLHLAVYNVYAARQSIVSRAHIYAHTDMPLSHVKTRINLHTVLWHTTSYNTASIAEFLLVREL